MGRKIKKGTVDLGLLETYRVKLGEDCPFSVGKLHWIGKREEQQDSFGMSEWNPDDDRGMLFVVADGMGGMDDGAGCSSTAVVSCLSAFDELSGELDENALENIARIAGDDVTDFLYERGSRGGSTLLLGLIQNGVFYWATVGDSHIYLYCEDGLIQLNQDHNYAMRLDEMVENGEISEFDAETDPQRKALISYLGVPDEMLVDKGKFDLYEGDRILMSSDGVFGVLSEDEIAEALEFSPEKAMMRMEMLLMQRNVPTQDNSTAICIEYR